MDEERDCSVAFSSPLLLCIPMDSPHVEFSADFVDALCAPIEWDQEKFNVGIKQIDGQNRTLIALINRVCTVARAPLLQLHHVPASPTYRPEPITLAHMADLRALFVDFVTFCVKELEAENRLMETHAYHDRASHFVEHDAFVRSVRHIHKLVDDNAVEPRDLQNFLRFLREWLRVHIPVMDRQCASFLADKVS